MRFINGFNSKLGTVGSLIFLSSFFLYSASSPGNIPGDSELRWSVARQIVRQGSFCLEQGVGKRLSFENDEGKRYPFYGLGQSLLMLPIAFLSILIERFGITPETANLCGQFLVSLVLFPAIGAAAVLVFYRLVMLLGYSKRCAILSSVIFGFCTMHFHYSENTHEATQLELLLILAIYFMVKYYQQKRFVYMWCFCTALGGCLIFRLPSVVIVLPLYVVAAGAEIFSGKRDEFFKTTFRWILAGISGTGIFLIICGWHNYIRFGSVFESGYSLARETLLCGHRMFESSPLPTLGAMLFSPGKSIFLYNPVLLFLPFCFYSFWKKHKMVTLAISCAVIGNLAFYSFFTMWAGDYTWSIRYQVPILGFLVLPLAVLFEKKLKGLVKTVVISVIGVSIIIQMASVVYNFNLEYVQNPNHCLIPDGYVWRWSESHLQMRFKNIFEHLNGERNFSSVPVEEEDPCLLKSNNNEESVRYTYVVNFFPFKAKGNLGTGKLFYILLFMWTTLLLCFCASGYKLFRLIPKV